MREEELRTELIRGWNEELGKMCRGGEELEVVMARKRQQIN